MKAKKDKRKSAVYNRIRRRNIVFGTFAVVILCVLSLFTPVFNVSEVTVVGNKVLSPEAIIAAADIREGDNFIFINTSNREKRINALGYVDKVEVKRKFFTRIEIEVTEAKEIAHIAFSGNYVGIDSGGKVLSITKAGKLRKKKVVISGVAVAGAKKGEILEVKSQDKFSTVMQIIDSLKNKELLSRTAGIDVTEMNNIKVTLKGDTEILLGDSSEIDFKMEYAMIVLEKHDDSAGGVVDIRNTSNVIYQPGEGGAKK